MEGLVCDRCAIAFPVTDGIPILLPAHARNYEVELPLVESLFRVLLIAADCADVYADFVGITGSAPIGPIPPICVAPSV